MAELTEQAWHGLLARAHRCGRPRQENRNDGGLLGLYQSFLEPTPDGLCVLAHLGQSLDGCIATANGDAAQVTGPDNIVHLHRLRALADAVLVGAGTVAHDDPQLTTRLVDGSSPLRVVLDPDRRLDSRFGLFCQGPPTLLLCRRGQTGDGKIGEAPVESVDDWSPGGILQHLRDRGARRLFIEGGGVTVSWFVAARCVDYLHICISPVLIGNGRRGLSGPVIDRMDDAIRPPTTIVAMGSDRLFASILERASLGQSTER